MARSATTESNVRRPPGARHAAAIAAIAPSAVLSIAMFGASPLAAANPEFAGIWQLDVDRSDSISRGRPDQEQPPVDVEIEIGLDGEDLDMVFTMRRDDWAAPARVSQRVTTNGKPHQVPNLRGDMRTVRAKWRKARLSLSYTARLPYGEFDITETWQLSRDGSELQVTMHTRIPDRRPDIRKFIYTRATTVQ